MGCFVPFTSCFWNYIWLLPGNYPGSRSFLFCFWIKCNLRNGENEPDAVVAERRKKTSGTGVLGIMSSLTKTSISFDSEGKICDFTESVKYRANITCGVQFIIPQFQWRRSDSSRSLHWHVFDWSTQWTWRQIHGGTLRSRRVRRLARWSLSQEKIGRGRGREENTRTIVMPNGVQTYYLDC